MGFSLPSGLEGKQTLTVSLQPSPCTPVTQRAADPQDQEFSAGGAGTAQSGKLRANPRSVVEDIHHI